MLKVKSKGSCAYDIVSLGEVMLRLDPGEGRIKTARRFSAWEGGGEYNVARGLRKCFGQRAAVVTAFADNEVGRLVEDFICQGGVDTSFIKWFPYDGLGRTIRNGLNFTERGFGIRAAKGVSDRGHTAASRLKSGDINWEELFGKRGVRWFHTGGIYAALSETTPAVIEKAMKTAKKHGTVISYDLNYRPSLWKSFGGLEKARQVNRRLAKFVDVMIGNEEDFTASLGFEVEGTDENLSNLEVENFKKMITNVTKKFKNFQVIATTLRTVKTATVNDWGAIAWSNGKFAHAVHREGLEIMDRVGGGDSFASGLIYGLLSGKSLNTAVNYGAAHGALAMTTPGDTTMASLAEVEHLVKGGGARVVR
jgi:2-dehydro-3-deoxygluconokinase